MYYHQARQKNDELENLENENRFLKRKLVESQFYLKNFKKKSSESLEALKITNNEELDFFRRNNERLNVGLINY